MLTAMVVIAVVGSLGIVAAALALALIFEFDMCNSLRDERGEEIEGVDGAEHG